jgi:hypothetical protein
VFINHRDLRGWEILPGRRVVGEFRGTENNSPELEVCSRQVGHILCHMCEKKYFFIFFFKGESPKH